MKGNGAVLRPSAGSLGMAVFLAVAGMLFVAFTAALLVRRAGADWRSFPLPPIFWWNTLLLLGASVSLHAARRGAAGPWIAAAFLLSFGFVAGQIFGWRELWRSGLTLSSSPLASFVYVLSGVHAVHLAGGVAALVWVARRKRSAIGLCAVYWHFLALVWIALLVLFRLA